MNEVFEFLKKAGTFYLATAEGDQPRVRPFGAVLEVDGRLWRITGRKKDVYRQIAQNPKAEIVAMDGGKWMRIETTLVDDDSMAAKEAMLEAYPSLKGLYSPTDSNMAVLYMNGGKATLSSMTDAPVVYEL